MGRESEVAVHHASIIFPTRSFGWLRGRAMISFSIDSKVDIYRNTGPRCLLCMLSLGEKDHRDMQPGESRRFGASKQPERKSNKE
jgi:hypothetical protein